MPTVGLNAEELFRRLEKTYTEDEFQALCFEFGLELDDVTSKKEEVRREQGDKAAEGLPEDTIYKLDIPANRYDLLCMEGIARSLRVFLGKDKAQEYTVVEPVAQPRQQIVMTQATQSVRPFVVGAVLRNVSLDTLSYDSFIDLQEKLHQNICRRRTLVAIGTHDLDHIQGPFTYDAQKPTDIKFKPLRAKDMSKEYDAAELMKEYETDLQLKKFLHIIKDKPKYPVIRDSNGVVLSMPPIINGSVSKISTSTKNIFIECTATDMTKAKVVLNMVVCMFSEYCEKPFTIEPVDVIRPDGSTETYPDLSCRTDVTSAELLNRRIGINCWAPKLAELLTQMQLPTKVSENGLDLAVTIPPTRPDVLHACDIWEDAAIAYGYNNIEWVEPQVVTEGAQQPINKLTDALRVVVSQAGFMEVLTFALCSLADGFKNLRRPDDGLTAAVIDNPCSVECEILRVSLLSGLLKTCFLSKDKAKPIKIFEVADVALLDPTHECGSRNRRRLGAMICSTGSQFEEIQALLDYVMKQLGVSRKKSTDADRKDGYYLLPSSDPAFFADIAAADVIYRGKRIGVMGVIHPEVLENFNIKFPCGALELEVEELL